MNSVRFASIVGVGILWGLLVACGGSQDDGQSGSADLSGAGAGGGSTSAAKIAPGDYVLDNSSVGATLTIHSATATSVSYDLGVLGKTGSQHNGELDNRTAKASGSSFNDTVDSDCKISLQASGTDSIQVKQTGPCTDAGFGAFLDGSGVYKKAVDAGAPPAASNGWVGLYETETTHRAFAIRISSESPFKFRLVAGHLEDSTERVDANLTAVVNGNSAVSENGPDCTITLSKNDLGGISVAQDGTCKNLGFPETGDLEMSDPTTDGSTSDFQRIDESTECFDTKELAVSIAKCQSPL
jgi:hypothetical protein